MSNGNGTDKLPTTGWTFVDALMSRYGLLAFGVVVLLVVNQSFFQPYLLQQRIDWTQNQQQMRQLETTVTKLVEIEQSHQRQLILLERLLTELRPK